VKPFKGKLNISKFFNACEIQGNLWKHSKRVLVLILTSNAFETIMVVIVW